MFLLTVYLNSHLFKIVNNVKLVYKEFKNIIYQKKLHVT